MAHKVSESRLGEWNSNKFSKALDGLTLNVFIRGCTVGFIFGIVVGFLIGYYGM